MAIRKQLKQRVVNVGLVLTIVFASGYVLQESELLGQSPRLPGKVTLEAFVEDSGKASFTSSRSSGMTRSTVFQP